MHFYIDRLQRCTDARACHTCACFDNKQGSVSRALDEFAVVVEKLIVIPVELDALVRAAIHVSKPVLVFFDHKNGGTIYFKAFASTMSDFLNVP